MSRRSLFLVALWCVAVVRGAPASPADVLIVADDTVIAPLRGNLSESVTTTRASWTFWSGTLAGKSVVLARSEGDPLNAVAVTTLAIRQHAPRLIVTAGIARAHDPELRSGDLVVSEKFAAIDGMVTEHRELGEGSDGATWQKLPHALMTPGEKEVYIDSFPADASAAAVALQLQPRSGRTISGVLGSAHQINREADRVAALRALWGTSSEDTESAHVAGCAKLFGIPAVGLRVIDGDPSEVSALTLQFLEAWK